ncbi:unnamed protein product [Ambrosiozyma monospora]|uniref:Unnamed protein product n=1 Tax=Ambrosiozyma monospora TaxID=43982 RepID=A0ACB5T484_AMBMO|nr:unnamed protein product [Ambrosiozyma monospora]
MPLKKQKELKRKYNASKQQFSWNSLYMNNDAVLESVASSLGISKSELADPENSSSAVKQALAEAHVINDVRKYFEQKKIDLTKFGSSKEKDDRIILVKNFQHGTTQEEIGELFATHGELKRILMPPAGTIAIVEFRDASSGRSAFNKLAFRRMGKSILYLEKGPKDLFTGEPEEEESVPVALTETKEGKDAKVSASDVLDVEAEEDVEDHTGPTVSVFVKNLNFTTTQSDLTRVFKPLDGFIVATIKTKPDVKHPGKVLSMGFGFAEFKTMQQAKNAINALDGYTLDGHNLQLKISNRVSNLSSSETKKSKKKTSTKIIVKNLPFESTRKDLFSLFQTFGNLKSVRVPKKFNKSARGFAFVEFSTLQEAGNAMDQLQGVHLLGRRLVLDYAEKETDVEGEIERMTKRARKQTQTRKMADLRETYGGKRKLDLSDDEE